MKNKTSVAHVNFDSALHSMLHGEKVQVPIPPANMELNAFYIHPLTVMKITVTQRHHRDFFNSVKMS